MLVLSAWLLSDVMAEELTDHNGALSAALELFGAQELNKCYFLTVYNHSNFVNFIISMSKERCTVFIKTPHRGLVNCSRINRKSVTCS